jgi:hypothetical protein
MSTERMSDYALCKRMIEQVCADLLAVGEIVEFAYGEGVSKQLFDAVMVLNDDGGELTRLFKIKPEAGRLDIHAERARRQKLAG